MWANLGGTVCDLLTHFTKSYKNFFVKFFVAFAGWRLQLSPLL